jgi:hypothetical protein
MVLRRLNVRDVSLQTRRVKIQDYLMRDQEALLSRHIQCLYLIQCLLKLVQGILLDEIIFNVSDACARERLQ